MLAPDQAAHLMARAEAAAQRAYAPYSHFPVGAAILTASGAVFEGGNIENASYPLTICAERAAAAAAAFAGEREFVAVAVATPRSPGSTPCGACRQFLNEFKAADGSFVVLLQTPGQPAQVPFADLLPRAFGPQDLET